MSRGQRQQSGPPVTSVPALTSHQLVRLPTRRTVSLPCLAFAPKSSTFVQQDICRPRTVPGPPHTSGIHLICRSAKIPCAGTVGSPDSLPLRTTVVQYPKTAIQSQQRVEYKDYSSIAHT